MNSYKTGETFQMNKSPSVTILIANYNYEDYVCGAIKSALEQDYDGPLQVCVIDDGSTDGSWKNIREMLKEVKIQDSKDPEVEEVIHKNISTTRRIVAIRRSNGGASAARNTGIDHCWNETDIYGILDADDEYYSNKVRVCVDKLIEHPGNVAVVYGDYDIHYTEKGIVVREFKRPYDRQVLMHECMVHSGALILRTALEQVKEENGEYFDRSLHGPGSEPFIGCSEDYDLWLRMSEHFMIFHIPESLAMMRETGRNQTSNVSMSSQGRTQRIIEDKIRRRAGG